MKFQMIFVFLVGFLSFVDGSFAKGPIQCSSLFFQDVRSVQFENGHNVPLRNIMLKISEYEMTIEEFVSGLNPTQESKYLKDSSEKFRNPQKLLETLAVAQKYERILTHLVLHADSIMMSEKIERIPQEKRAEFTENYKLAYINYLATFKKLIAELESFKMQDPKNWNNKTSRLILMELNTQMGNAHNRF